MDWQLFAAGDDGDDSQSFAEDVRSVSASTEAGHTQTQAFEDVVSMRDNLILLIDARKGMLRTNERGETIFDTCLKAAIDLLKSKIIASPDDRVGIVFMGTRERKTRENFEGVYVASPLETPAAETIQMLQDMLPGGAIDVEEMLGHEPETSKLPLDKALWACTPAFGPATTSKSPEWKRIFIFTSEANPNSQDSSLREQCIQRARDAHEANQVLVVYGFTHGPQSFDFSHFWDMVATPHEEDDIDDGGGGSTRISVNHEQPFDVFVDRFRHKIHKKRTYARLPFKIGDDMSLSVGIYMNIYPAKKPNAVKRERSTTGAVRSVTQYISQDTGASLMPHQMKTYHTFGGKKVYFSRAEINQIKTFGDPGIVLCGFKPRSMITDEINLRSPYFIFPNENAIKGSTTAFAALHARMIARDKVAIARFIPRVGASPRFVALLPVTETTDEYDDAQLSPPGMYAIPLPFADDIRTIQSESVSDDPTTEAIATAKDIIVSLTLPEFQPRQFRNPVLQKFYAGLQAVALNEDDIPWSEEDDDLRPDKEGMSAYSEKLETFQASITPAGYVGVKRSSGTVRKREPAPISEISSDLVSEWKLAQSNGTLQKKKVDELKEFLRAANEKVSGKKADLLERVEGFLNSHQTSNESKIRRT